MQVIALKTQENHFITGFMGYEWEFPRYTKGKTYSVLRGDEKYLRIQSDKGDIIWVERVNFVEG